MPSKEYTTSAVTSTDGTVIGYRQIGAGPGLLLVHGGLQASQNFTELGKLLSDEFTVYIPDRRGRGLSGPHGNYSLEAEGEDMQAIIAATGTEYIFGLSSGAIVTLFTAIHTPSLKKVALYEPPIPVKGSPTTKWYRRYEKQLKKGDLGKAMVHIMKGTGDFSLFTALPSFITGPLVNAGLKKREKDAANNVVSLRELIPTFEYDHIAVQQSEGIIEKSGGIKANVLLIGGSKSKKFLKLALRALADALPDAKLVELKGLGHIAADNSESPDVVAEVLSKFFKG